MTQPEWVRDWHAHPQLPQPERHECQRCGSDTWTQVSYSGCTDCAPEAFLPVGWCHVRTDHEAHTYTYMGGEHLCRGAKDGAPGDE